MLRYLSPVIRLSFAFYLVGYGCVELNALQADGVSIELRRRQLEKLQSSFLTNNARVIVLTQTTVAVPSEDTWLFSQPYPYKQQTNASAILDDSGWFIGAPTDDWRVAFKPVVTHTNNTLEITLNVALVNEAKLPRYFIWEGSQDLLPTDAYLISPTKALIPLLEPYSERRLYSRRLPSAPLIEPGHAALFAMNLKHTRSFLEQGQYLFYMIVHVPKGAHQNAVQIPSANFLFNLPLGVGDAVDGSAKLTGKTSSNLNIRSMTHFRNSPTVLATSSSPTGIEKDKTAEVQATADGNTQLHSLWFWIAVGLFALLTLLLLKGIITKRNRGLC
jgi:hypothetical protein